MDGGEYVPTAEVTDYCTGYMNEPCRSRHMVRPVVRAENGQAQSTGRPQCPPRGIQRKLGRDGEAVTADRPGHHDEGRRSNTRLSNYEDLPSTTQQRRYSAEATLRRLLPRRRLAQWQFGHRRPHVPHALCAGALCGRLGRVPHLPLCELSDADRGLLCCV